jgi:hypothetical protein
MLLLAIRTLLATTGMSMSTAELVMAGNEQFHREAADAAAAGIEAVIAQLAVTPPAAGNTITSAAAVGDGGPAMGDYAATARYAGEESNLPRSSAEKFTALHFQIESTGRSARNARDVQTQGVMVVTAPGGVTTFRQLGTGLQEEPSR